MAYFQKIGLKAIAPAATERNLISGYGGEILGVGIPARLLWSKSIRLLLPMKLVILVLGNRRNESGRCSRDRAGMELMSLGQ
jgi:hypothetical protein